MTVTTVGRSERLTDQVAEEIRGWLGKRRMSQAQLARTLGQSQMWVSDRLRGEQEIGLNDLQRIAKVLDVQIIDLFPRELVGPNHRSASVAVRPMPTPRSSPFRASARPKGRGRRDSTRPSSPVRPGQRRPVPVPPPTVQPIPA